MVCTNKTLLFCLFSLYVYLWFGCWMKKARRCAKGDQLDSATFYVCVKFKIHTIWWKDKEDFGGPVGWQDWVYTSITNQTTSLTSSKRQTSLQSAHSFIHLGIWSMNEHNFSFLGESIYHFIGQFYLAKKAKRLAFGLPLSCLNRYVHFCSVLFSFTCLNQQ